MKFMTTSAPIVRKWNGVMTVFDDYVTLQRVIKYASTFIHRPVCVSRRR